MIDMLLAMTVIWTRSHISVETFSQFPRGDPRSSQKAFSSTSLSQVTFLTNGLLSLLNEPDFLLHFTVFLLSPGVQHSPERH